MCTKSFEKSEWSLKMAHVNLKRILSVLSSMQVQSLGNRSSDPVLVVQF